MKTANAFTLARSDRITLAVIFICLTGWEFTKRIWPHPPARPVSVADATADDTAPGHDGRAVRTMRRVDGDDGQWTNDTPRTWPNANPTERDMFNTSRGPVDIMEADVDELTANGFSRQVARNIVRYREAGGKLRDSAALLRIYGMSPDIWNRVSGKLVFPNEDNRARSGQADHRPESRPLDLNAATAEELESLPGIGPALAGRIIRYRTMLGGFHDVDQLGECYGMPPETVTRLRDRLRIATPPSRLMVNRTRLDSVYHPYVPRKVLRVLQAYKHQHGNLKDESDLRRAYPADTTWIRRMLPYLDYRPQEQDLPLLTTNKPKP